MKERPVPGSRAADGSGGSRRPPGPGRVAALAGAVALGAGWLLLLGRARLLEADDPLAGTVALLPVVAALLAVVARQAPRRGGRAAAAGGTAAAGVALLAVLLAARPHLPGSFGDELWMAGLVLLLAFVTARLLLALRPLLGRRLPERPAPVFFLLPFAVYLALIPWSTGRRPPDGDEPWYLLITHSLAYDGDAELGNNYAAEDWRSFIDRPLEPQPGDPRGPDGQVYSRHNVLLPLVLALPYRLAGKLGALVTMAALTAALAWMTLRLGRHYTPELPGETLAAYALVAFAPPLLLYSYQIWVEVPAALLSMVALDRILGLEGQRRRGAATRGSWLVIALSLVLLPLLKIRFMLLALPLLGLAWWRSGRPWRPALLLALALGLAGGGLLLHNQLLYDNPLKIHTWEEVELYRYGAGRYASGFAGLFYDAAFGLFACAPLWLLVIPAIAGLARRRRRLPADLAVFALPYLAIVAPRSEWFGGWSPPFRYALIALPLLGLGLAPLLARRRRAGARALLAGLGSLTLVLAALWVAVPGWTYNFADGRTYLLDHLSRLVGGDVARLFPSYVRFRPAGWIWPAATFLAVPALWWLPGRRWLRRPGLAGVAALLAAAALVPAAARTLPTRVVELEDPQVYKAGGHLYPDRWVIERPRYRGGWVLREGEALRAPVVAGGGRVEITLHALFVRHRRGPRRLPVQLWAGEELLATVPLAPPRRWRSYRIDEVAWPSGAPLVLRVPPAQHRGQPSGAVLDRVELRWR